MNHQFSRARGRLFAGVVAVLVLVAVVIVGAFALGMYPFSGEAASSNRALDSVSGRIAFVSNRDGDAEIYVMNADRSGLVQLTDNDSDDLFPSWSPDGSRIMLTSDRDNEDEVYDIYVMNADGSRVERLTDGCSNHSLAWSPDGGRIAFTSRGDVYVMNVDGSDVVQLTGEASASCASVFFSDRDSDGYNEIYSRNADGSVRLFTDWGT